ncbi:hypothetical protein EDB92DRAFT_427446 [Lactarius akahatsu]|uniref:Uncharacterized protein n=1 Tax=Lactarius akahatsu TaxID=416441 RepID=A0AAD4L6T6_9AGAM|nr:hypothetical protein EDB92DRAFT_427446 [Lactarius akahatsu]
MQGVSLQSRAQQSEKQKLWWRWRWNEETCKRRTIVLLCPLQGGWVVGGEHWHFTRRAIVGPPYAPCWGDNTCSWVPQPHIELPIHLEHRGANRSARPSVQATCHHIGLWFVMTLAFGWPKRWAYLHHRPHHHKTQERIHISFTVPLTSSRWGRHEVSVRRK